MYPFRGGYPPGKLNIAMAHPQFSIGNTSCYAMLVCQTLVPKVPRCMRFMLGDTEFET